METHKLELRSISCYWAAAILTLLPYTATAQDALACSPSEKRSKAVAICAAAVGGCAAAESFANSADRAFLQGSVCDALVSKITGQRYDLVEFLGSAAATALNSYGSDQIKEGNIAWGITAKIASALYKGHQFYSCVESARAMCEVRYQAQTGGGIAGDSDPLRTLVKSYYEALTAGDLRKGNDLRWEPMNERSAQQFSAASHSWNVNDITVTDCHLECNVLAYVTGKSKSTGESELWLVTIQVDAIAPRVWRIKKITGSNLVTDIGNLVRAYFGSLSSGDLSQAKKYWLQPPQNLQKIVTDKFKYSANAWLTKVDQSTGRLNLEVFVESKLNSEQKEVWKGEGIVIYDARRWKFVNMGLQQQVLEAQPIK